MTPIASCFDYEYPIHIYLETKELPAASNEIHLNPFTFSGTCWQVRCDHCPVATECSNKQPLTRIFPELIAQYPEYLI